MPEPKSAERTVVNVLNVFSTVFSLASGGYGSHLVLEIGFRELGSSENPS